MTAVITPPHGALHNPPGVALPSASGASASGRVAVRNLEARRNNSHRGRVRYVLFGSAT